MNRTVRITLTVCLLLLSSEAVYAQTATAGLMKLLKSGKIPATRQPQIIDMVCERGGADDLAYIFDQATSAKGFDADVRLRALEALAEASVTRKVKPAGDLTGLSKLIEANEKEAAAARAVAIRLAGLWKVEALSPKLEALALDAASDDALRRAALNGVTAIGGKAARTTIDKLVAPGQPQKLRYLGVAALTKVNLEEAAKQAAAVLADGSDRDDPLPLVSAFFDQKLGPRKVTVALAAQPPSRDVARLMIRGMYAIGRSDPALVDLLQKTAGISAEFKPVTGDELAKLVAEVNAKGDAARGEKVLRRADLSCLKCHSINKAGGDIGPDLSAIGSISPVDYIINSIIVPELAVKENFIMTTVVTNDGRVIQGIATEKNNQRWILKDATGKLTSIAKEDIDEEETKEGGSLMPKGLPNLMTHGEFLDLVRFVSELGKPGPYAIRTIPTIQRWRVLQDVPADLAAAVPNPDKFKAEVLDAPEENWRPAYGMVSGDLPLAELATARDAKGGPEVAYLYGELEVTEPGLIQVDTTMPSKSNLWLGDVFFGETRQFKRDFDVGVHKFILRVNVEPGSRETVKMEFGKPAGSTVEFAVLGGR